MVELMKAPWPDWETVRLIGRGSFGTVYEIQRKLVDEDTESAALKVITIPQNPGDVEELYSEGYDDESITATFNSHLKSIVAEYSLMRKMDGSANIVNCKDIRYIQHDDGIGWDIFIRMELLTPLMKALPVDIAEQTIIKIGKDICNALVLCKKHEIIHRDIKPQNIFVSPNGDYKLGDFGIAKTIEKTMGGTKIGTYKYMAPEVYNNQPYGSAADIYSLGLVLYWLLNERRMPFMPLPPAKLGAGMDEEARHRRLSGEKLPAPAHGSDELKRIVLKACAYDPKDRYTSAADMLEDLNKLTGGVSVIPPVMISDGEEEEKQDDDMTMGPVFGVRNQSEVDSLMTGDSDATVGPTFAEKPKTVEKQNTASSQRTDPLPEDSRKKTRNFKYKYEIIAVGFILAIVLFLLLRSCGGENRIAQHQAQNAMRTTTTTTTTTTTGSNSGTLEQLTWSNWTDKLPANISADKYEIEEKTLYSSRELETTSSTEKSTMPGWELYDTVEANGEFGPWSDWSKIKAEASATREFDTQARYRYRDKETTSSTSSTMDGWTCYDSKENYIYGAWSAWSDNVIYPNNSIEVEERVFCWDYICDRYANGVLVSSGNCLPSTTDRELRVGDVFYEYQNSGGPKVTYIVTDIRYWYEYRSRTVTQTATMYYFYRWGNWSSWSENKVSATKDRQVENALYYRYRDQAKTTTYFFRRWTDWSTYSENPVTASETREVQTKTQYRYKEK